MHCMRSLFVLLLLPLLLYGELSLRDKVGQLIMATAAGEEFTEETRAFLEKSHLGNLILLREANGLKNPEQIKRLTMQLNEAISQITGFAPLIAIDHEGGSVVRLSEGFTFFPGNGALGKLNSPSLAFQVGQISGEELSSVGINTILGPVVDTNTNPNNPVIGIRSFGSNPNQVIALGKEMLRGLRSSGMITVLKHFPGHGDTKIDSHFALPVCTKETDLLAREELLPFHELSPLSDALMSAHVLYPALDPNQCATLSTPILRTLLRDTWGFEGVVFSDSIAMAGLIGPTTGFTSARDAIAQKGVEALSAGCDCLIIAIDPRTLKVTISEEQQIIEAVIDAICLAVQNGTLSPKEIDASFERMCKLKAELPSPGKAIKAPHPLAEEIAEKALMKLTPKESPHYPLSAYTIVAPSLLKEQVAKALSGASLKTCFFPFPLSEKERTSLLETLQPPLLFLCYKGVSDPQQLLLLEQLAATLKGPELIIAGVGNPSDVEKPSFTRAHLTYQTFSPAPASLRALLHAIETNSD